MQHSKRQARKYIKRMERVKERKSMAKSFKYGMLCLIVFFGSLLTTVAAYAVEVTYYAKSHHFRDLPYNEEHRFIGLEFRDTVSSYGIASFKNSFRENSIMVNYSRYWQPYRYIELNFTGGITTGYDKLKRCKSLNSSSDLCPIISMGITYTKYKYFKPRLSLFGGALVLSIRGEI